MEDSTRKIKLNNGMYVIVDAEDFEWLNQFKWHYVKCGNKKSDIGGYARNQNGTMHRQIIKTPNGYQTDHINGDKLDNRKCNLRAVTATQNARRKHFIATNNKSGYKGVSWFEASKQWKAQVWSEGKAIYLGLFKTPEEAAKRYDAYVEIRYNGEWLTNKQMGLLEG